MQKVKSITKLIAIVSLICFFALSAIADQTDCPGHFADGQAPTLVNQKLATMTRDICYSGFAIKHSGITRTPIYSAEHLTRERLQQAHEVGRQGQFHADVHLPAAERAELHHYARSGFDRGHVAPSADMADIQSQQECFSLANMVPQVPANNRGPWEGIEAAVRRLAEKKDELYVVTGPIFGGENLQRIGGAVMVPTQLFKAVYDPLKQEAGAYLIDNAADAVAQKISVAALEKLTGINIFPSLKEGTKSKLMNLPEPKSFRERKK
ncbi:MAG: DNA/RNA non-specific endonuclease [Pseudomonadota bacterium]